MTQTRPSIGKLAAHLTDRPDRRFRALEALSLAGTLIALWVTVYLFPLDAVEYNPVNAWLIDTLGWYATAGIALLSISGTFALLWAARSWYISRVWAVMGGAFTLFNLGNAVNDLFVFWSHGVFPTSRTGELLTFMGATAGIAALVFCRSAVVATLRRVGMVDRPRPSRDAARALALAFIMALSMPAMAGAYPLDDTSTVQSVDDDLIGEETKLWEHGHHSTTVHGVHEYEGVVYSVDSNGIIIAADADDGTKLWEKSLTENNLYDVHAENGLVFTGGYDEEVFALDPETGGIEWTHNNNSNRIRSILVAGNTVYSQQWGTKIIAADTSDGDLLWEGNYASGTPRGLGYDDGELFTPGGSDEVNIYRVDASDGSLIDSTQVTTDTVNGHAVAAGDGNVYLGYGGFSGFRVYDSSTLEEEWNQQSQDEVRALEHSDGTVYSGSEDNSVAAVNAEDGSIIWEHNIHSNSVRALHKSDGKLYSGSSDTTVVAVDASPTVVSGHVVDNDGNGITANVSAAGQFTQTNDAGAFTLLLDDKDENTQVAVEAETAIDSETKYVHPTQTGLTFELTPGDLRVVNQNGEPVEGAHVRIAGPREAMLDADPSDAEALRAEAEALLDEFGGEPDQWDPNLNLGTALEDFENTDDVVYPAVHTKEDWDPSGWDVPQGTVHRLPSEMLDLSQPRVNVPAGEPFVITLWDGSEDDIDSGLLPELWPPSVGDDPVNDELYGEVTPGTIEITQLGPGGQATSSFERDTREFFEFDRPLLPFTSRTYHATEIMLSPGFYQISATESDFEYTVVVGNPDQLVDSWLEDVEDDAGELLDEAQSIEDAIQNDNFWTTREITDENGAVTIGGLPDDVPVADIRAFKGPDAEELVLADIEGMNIDTEDVTDLTQQDIIEGVEEGYFDSEFFMASRDRVDEFPVVIEGTHLDHPPGGNFTDLTDEYRDLIEDILGQSIENFDDYEEALQALIAERDSLLTSVENMGDFEDFESHACEEYPTLCENGQLDLTEGPDDIEVVAQEVDLLRSAISTWDGTSGGDADIEVIEDLEDVLNSVITVPEMVDSLDDNFGTMEIIFEDGTVIEVTADDLEHDPDTNELRFVDDFELEHEGDIDRIEHEWVDLEDEDDEFGAGDERLTMTIELQETLVDDVDLHDPSQAVIAVFEDADGTTGTDEVPPADIDVYENADGNTVLEIDWVIPAQWDDWNLVQVQTIGLEAASEETGDEDIEEDIQNLLNQIIQLDSEIESLQDITVEVVYQNMQSEEISPLYLDLAAANELHIVDFPVGDKQPAYIQISGESSQIVNETQTAIEDVISDSVWLDADIDSLADVDLTVIWEDGTETVVADENIELIDQDDGTQLNVAGVDAQGRTVDRLDINVDTVSEVEDIDSQHYLNAEVEFDDGFLPSLSNVDLDDVSVFVEWQDGSTQSVPDDYWHIDGDVTGVGSVVIEDYPVPDDKAGGTLDVIAATEDNIYSVSEGFNSPGYAGEFVELDYVRTQTLRPNVGSTVTIEAGLDDRAMHVDLVGAEVLSPAGNILEANILADQTVQFTTGDGPGRYDVRLLFEDTSLDNPTQFRRTVSVEAAPGGASHSPVFHEVDEADDDFAFVAGGFMGGSVDAADGATSLVAQLDTGEDPSSIDVHPQPRGSDHTYRLEVVDGELEERLDEHMTTRIHVPLGDDALVYKDGSNPITTDRGQHGELNKENNTIRTFTDTDGTVDVRVIQDPSLYQRAIFQVRVLSPFSLVIPTFDPVTGGLAGLVATLTTLLAARRFHQ